jgi:hypothetical protein
MTSGSFLSGKLLKPRADGRIRIRGHAIALLAVYNQAPSQSLPWHGADRDFCSVIGRFVELTGSGNDLGWVVDDA